MVPSRLAVDLLCHLHAGTYNCIHMRHDRQTDRQTGRQMDRQTDRQIDR